jgi:hypothetical protein
VRTAVMEVGTTIPQRLGARNRTSPPDRLITHCIKNSCALCTPYREATHVSLSEKSLCSNRFPHHAPARATILPKPWRLGGDPRGTPVVVGRGRIQRKRKRPCPRHHRGRSADDRQPDCPSARCDHGSSDACADANTGPDTYTHTDAYTGPDAYTYTGPDAYTHTDANTGPDAHPDARANPDTNPSNPAPRGSADLRISDRDRSVSRGPLCDCEVSTDPAPHALRGRGGRMG